MGIYVNPSNITFQKILNSDIYIDKTDLISATNAKINKMNCYMCVSRPRRFGKSMAADMLVAYYSKGCDSAELFSGKKAESGKDFHLHLNRHNVIRLDIQRFLETEQDLDVFISEIERRVISELTKEFPECTDILPNGRLKMTLEQIFLQTGDGFIFIIDEWDCVFRMARNRKEKQKEYLDFLRGLFKGSGYVDLAYMTGILPIKKYGEHSAINIFDEYSMLSPKNLGKFFGFTEEEVQEQCEEYGVEYSEIQKWYDGYRIGELHMYNPKSVIDALTWKEIQSYWIGTETYEALKVYIDLNFDGLKEIVTMMLGNMHCKVNTRKFQNDMTTFKTKDDVLTLLVHLGYLTFDRKKNEVFIPNQEITQEEAIKRAQVPLKEFMLSNTDKGTVELFADMADAEEVEQVQDLPMTVVIPAFMTSELKRGFSAGFLLYIPFLLIDIVVSSTLMSMGMMMLPPAMISLPFKLLLFVTVNGWELLFSSIVNSFNIP